jgi:hypothetical protein
MITSVPDPAIAFLPNHRRIHAILFVRLSHDQTSFYDAVLGNKAHRRQSLAEGGNLSSRETLSGVVVIRITLHCHDFYTTSRSETHGLTTMTTELEMNSIIRKTFLTILLLRDGVRKHGSHGLV